MITKKAIIVLLCFICLAIPFGLLFNSMSNIEQQLEGLFYASENQITLTLDYTPVFNDRGFLMALIAVNNK